MWAWYTGLMTKTTTLKTGDRVHHRDATMVGTVVRVTEGAFSNGHLPMVTVDWPTGTRSMVTSTQLILEDS